MRTRLVILAATVAAAVTLTAAPAAAATSSVVVPRSSVSTRHAFHGAPNVGQGYYWLTFTARRGFDLHLYARHCAGGPGSSYLELTGANSRHLDGPFLDQKVYGASKVTLRQPMWRGVWTVYLQSTCDWGLSVPNRVGYVVKRYGGTR